MYISFTQLTKKSSIEQAYQFVAQQYNFREHPYFLWMNTQASRNNFLYSQLSFRYAVESFSCALAACLSKISSLEQRIHLAENVEEEHGGGDIKKSHKHTFIEYLQALGGTEEQINRPCSVGVRAFNESIRNFCLANPGTHGAALLGMIEYLYIDISAQIAKKITTAEWVLPNSQSHYANHEVLDVEHARELFDICTKQWKISPQEIAMAMALGGEYFWNLYSSMLEEATSEMAQ